MYIYIYIERERDRERERNNPISCIHYGNIPIKDSPHPTPPHPMLPPGPLRTAPAWGGSGGNPL